MQTEKAHLSLILLVFLLAFDCSEGMTRAQLNKSAKMMKNVCMPKSNVTPEQVQNINKGDFPNDPDVKCYIACIYQMAQTIKNGKLNYNAAMKQVDMLLPDEMKEPVKKALTTCRNVGDKIKDVCEASFTVAQCMYKADPENFVFP